MADDPTTGAGVPTFTAEELKAVVDERVAQAVAQMQGATSGPAPVPVPGSAVVPPPAPPQQQSAPTAPVVPEPIAEAMRAWGVKTPEAFAALASKIAPAAAKAQAEIDGLSPEARRWRQEAEETRARLDKLEQERASEAEAKRDASARGAGVKAFGDQGAANAGHALASAMYDGALRLNRDTGHLVPMKPDGAPTGESLEDFAKRWVTEHPTHAAAPSKVGAAPMPTGDRAAPTQAPAPDLTEPAAIDALQNQFYRDYDDFRAAIDSFANGRDNQTPPS